MDEPLSYEEYVQLLQMGGENADLANSIAMQMKQAEWMRSDAPQMRGNGRIMKAPNGLELLGNLARNKTSFDLDASSRKQQSQQTSNQAMQNQLIMQGILRRPTAPKQMDTTNYGGGL